MGSLPGWMKSLDPETRADGELEVLLEREWNKWTKRTLNNSINNANINNITKQEQEQLAKLGYDNGPQGQALIETHRRDFTRVKDNSKTNRGRQRIKEIILSLIHI